MPNKKELIQYGEKYGEVSKDCLDRIYSLLDGLNDKQLTDMRTNIQYNVDTEWKYISFIFWFLPKATPRARYTGFGKHFYVSDAMNNQKLMLNYVEEHLKDFPMITTACKFYCDTYFPTPSAMTKEEKVRAELKLIRHMSKPDWDNLGKTYSDMIQNTIIMDDSIIVDSRVSKYYSIKPRIEITIEYADRYDSKYNRKNITKRKQYIDNIEKIERSITN